VGDQLDGGSGADTFTMAANLSVGDTIVGGLGSDTMTITNDNATTDLNGVSGVEIFTVVLGNASSYTTVDTLVASGSTLTINQSGGSGLTFNVLSKIKDAS
jgi:Ca2+-binding RTX toxin-like protein